MHEQQGVPFCLRRVPLVLTVRAQFAINADERRDVFRLLLNRLTVLEAASQRIRELSLAHNGGIGSDA